MPTPEVSAVVYCALLLLLLLLVLSLVVLQYYCCYSYYADLNAIATACVDVYIHVRILAELCGIDVVSPTNVGIFGNVR